MEHRSQTSSPELWKQPSKKFNLVTKRQGSRQRLTKAASVHCLDKASTTVVCRPLFFRSPPPTGKRSISLQDLSPAKLGGGIFPVLDVLQGGEMSSSSVPREMRLAPERKISVMKAYARFLVAAWRSSRESIAQKNETLAAQLSQIQNLQIQSSSMKSLLDADVRMISDYCKEIRALTQKVQELETEKSHYTANLDELSNLKDQVECHSTSCDSFFEKTVENLNRIETKLEQTKQNRGAFEKTLSRMEEEYKKLAEEKEALVKKLETSSSKIVYLEECLNSKMMKIIELNSSLDAKCKDQWISGIYRKINAMLKVPLTILKLIHNSSLYN